MDLETLARAISELTTDEQMRLAHLLRRYEAGATLVPRGCDDWQEIGIRVDSEGRLRPLFYTPPRRSYAVSVDAEACYTLPHEGILKK